MRPIWTGGISFGLIYIPVSLYTATESVEIDLDLLSKKNLSPIRYARMEEKSGQEVAWKDVVKGYKHKKGDYVVLEQEDFEKVQLHRSKTIEIECFVDEEQIDTKFFEKPYYLEPQDGTEKTYALLVKALKDSKKVGIAEFIFKNREHLCALKAEDNMLVLIQMRYESEIRPSDSLNIPKRVEVKEKELKLAIDLIENMEEKFNPKDYKDDYITALKKIIDAKAKNKTVKVRKEQPKPTDVSDLMVALEKSLIAMKK
jgi:DNA end-binding protein Ku